MTGVCQPPIPPGDLLLHAGDLSVWGTFSEIQAQLTWLSQQQHRYKVVVAGNHDLLLDPEFIERHPERWEQIQQTTCSTGEADDSKTAKDLDWGGLIYLRNSHVPLKFPDNRDITIYGSPLTPQYGISAFQYRPSEDFWSGRIPTNTDIVLTHGPPWGHLDGLKKSGCAFLVREVARVRPQLVVYGHIHIGYGMEESVYDRVGKAYEAVMGQLGGRGTLVGMAWGIVWEWFLGKIFHRAGKKTIFVNAAVVEGWEEHVVKNAAVVVQILVNLITRCSAGYFGEGIDH
ncbi:hypothetical protein EPUS_05444 [Endocarpon pusillum Z07020]|uniref:Calcineurin-like phosphoesterase domain-containing protein n=1 Tax=Endocarpon pusillum (strain Z07020 / HMAS-L-300199) TaxID=1263415 RepID=U1HI76_ENDPU|nr:uncharacterized protein EPUS_05444 [Endocarpon pusillum Z07020]ERF69900.1 hypothetical protein EPUS_05444 [Endocarpon pusillum Z07020]